MKNNKILINMSKITLAIMFFLQPSTTQADIFSLEDFNATKYARHYNSLPSVEESDEALKSSSLFAPFLKKAESVVFQYDELIPHVGLRLTHHHFFVNNQIMAEEHQIYKEQPSLVTSAYEIDDAFDKRMVPSSWVFGSRAEEDIKVFEASNDTAVHIGSKLVQKNPEFLDEMAKLLIDNNLNGILAVALLKRDALVANEDQIYLETNYSENDKSVVQLWDISKQNNDSITTSWSFRGPREQACRRETVCIPDSSRKGGHEIRSNHKKY